jgi:lysophospholipase L1-like esterase
VSGWVTAMWRSAVAALLLAVALPSQAAVCALLGDSIAAGSGLPTSQSRFVFLLQAERQVEIRDLSSPGAALGAPGIGGFNNVTTTNQLTALAGMFSYLNCVIIQAGTNDYGRSIPWQDTVTGLTKVLNWARTNNKKVLVLDPIWRAGEEVPNALGHTLNTYRYMNWLTCTSNFADVCSVAHRTNSVMGTAGGAMNYQSSEVSTGTQLHPNANGQRIIADWIKTEAAASGLF